MRWLCLLLPLTLSAIEYAPWLDPILYFKGKVNASYEGGRSVDLFRDEASLRVTPWTDLRAEFEIDFFKSRRYSYCLEALKLSGQYRVLNDVTGDPISLLGAATFILPTTRAKRERALFYPGAMEYEFHLSIGKSWEEDEIYLDLAYGLANEHAPWWRTHAQLDHRFCSCDRVSIYAKTITGASVRTAEFGAIYKYFLDYGALSLTLARRPIAHHFPRATIITLEYETPIAF